jgi:PAS domain S-box-containing protein
MATVVKLPLPAGCDRLEQWPDSPPDPRFVESLPVGIVQVDPLCRVRFANRRFCELTGYTSEELLGRAIGGLLDASVAGSSSISPPGSAAAWGSEQEAVLCSKSGERIWVCLQGSALTDPRGAGAGAVFLCSDITDRKRSEERRGRITQQIEVVAREWQLTFDAVASPMLLLDPEARVLRMNHAAMELSGRPYSLNLMQPVDSLGEGQPWRACAEIVRRVGATAGPAQASAEDPGAGRTWDLTASRVVRGDRAQDSVIVIAKDVSDLVALQRSLRRSELMSALGSLVAGVAHEVRNPLFAISATLDAFEAEHGTEHQFGEYLEILRHELGRMSGLMRDLLDYGRPIEPRLVPASVGRTIRQAAEACQALARRARVEIEVALSEDLPELFLDEPRMTQVFTNLLENAIQHSPAGGRVEIGARQDDGLVDCSVSDRGPGFQEEDRPHLFEPFFSRRRGGTGLGLALVQRIVEGHGGQVSCGNRPEGGARVSVRLPAALRLRG